MVLALCLGIFARRYGPTTRQAGRLVALPFLALLITPAPSVQASGSPSILWAPVVAVLVAATSRDRPRGTASDPPRDMTRT